MLVVRLLVITFCCGCVFLSPELSFAQQVRPRKSELSLVLKVEKAKMCRGDKLYLLATLLNESKTTDVINSDGLFSLVRFSSIRKIDGKVRSDNVTGIDEIDEDATHSYVLLKPGERLKREREVNLNSAFFGHEGTYSVAVTYRNYRRKALGARFAWTGDIESNLASFIIEPCPAK